MDKERLKQVLEELRSKHGDEWKKVESEILQHFEEIRKIVKPYFQNNKEINFETAKKIYHEHIEVVNNLTNPYLLWVWPSPFGGSVEEDIENMRTKILNATREVLIEAEELQPSDIDSFKSKIEEALRSTSGVKIATLSSWLCVFNPKLFMPTWSHIINRQFRDDFNVRRFWGSDHNVKEFIEFTKTVKEVANRLEIDSMIEVAFYLSKYKSSSNSNNGIKKEVKEKLESLLNSKKQVILYGPPGTGKTWLAETYVKAVTNDNRSRYEFVTFHPSYAYEEFVEGLRPYTENGQIIYGIMEGIFKRICREAFNELLIETEIEKEWKEGEDLPELTEGEKEKVRYLLERGEYPKYYLVIDEINRGDISRIFGELITLLEADKRLFAENEIVTILPYSKTRFGVPPNLFIIGTMNTADRSIALIDIALRRRFGFIELMPSYKVLINELGIGNVNNEDDAIRMIESWNENDLNNVKKLAVKVLYSINEKIKRVYDRDHQIGHSYFLKLKDCETRDKTIETLKYIWFHEVIPLLQEYFYDSPKKLKEVLSDKFVIVDENEITYEFKQMEDFSDDDFLNALRELAQRGE